MISSPILKGVLSFVRSYLVNSLKQQEGGLLFRSWPMHSNPDFCCCFAEFLQAHSRIMS